MSEVTQYQHEEQRVQVAAGGVTLEANIGIPAGRGDSSSSPTAAAAAA